MPSQRKLPLPILPRGGAIGSVVQLSATGLPPNRTLIIAFANLQKYQLMQRVDTDGQGSFQTTQVVPAWADVDGVHYLFASFSDEIPLALSDGFHVTAPDGTARVRGTVGDRTDGCVDLKNAGDVLYHLTGEIGERKPAEEVTVVGTIAGADACGGGGIVIAVKSIEVRPG